jgi:hypothetical protein
MSPNIKNRKFNPVHLCYAFSVALIWILALGLQDDWFSATFVCILAVMTFPPFEEEKKKTD